MKLGFIGLGLMGLPMAKNLLEAGYEMYVYNRSPRALEKAIAWGAKSCGTVSGVAKEADVILISMPNADITGVILEELLNSDAISTTVIADTSTIAPASARHLAEITGRKGIKYIDCPVSGGVTGAAAGSLTIMVGGDKETVETLNPVFNTIGKNIYHVGDVGTGSAMKMINNLLLGCNMAAVSEALVLGSKLGLDLSTMQEIIKNSTGRSFIIENKVPMFIMKRNFTPGFSVDLEYKDLGLAVESAKQLNMPIPMTSMAVQLFEMARAKGIGGEDITALVKIWEDLMKVEVK